MDTTTGEYKIINRRLKIQMTSNPLVTAIRINDLDAARRMLSDEPGIANCIYDSHTPLMWAHLCRNWRMVSLLMEYGVDPTKSIEGYCSPLVHATDNPKILKVYLEHGIDPNERENAHSNTLLMHTASSRNHERTLECARLLIEHGARPNDCIRHSDGTETSALSIACKNRWSQIVGLLLDHGAIPSTQELVAYSNHQPCLALFGMVETETKLKMQRNLRRGALLFQALRCTRLVHVALWAAVEQTEKGWMLNHDWVVGNIVYWMLRDLFKPENIIARIDFGT